MLHSFIPGLEVSYLSTYINIYVHTEFPESMLWSLFSTIFTNFLLKYLSFSWKWQRSSITLLKVIKLVHSIYVIHTAPILTMNTRSSTERRRQQPEMRSSVEKEETFSKGRYKCSTTVTLVSLNDKICDVPICIFIIYVLLCTLDTRWLSDAAKKMWYKCQSWEQFDKKLYEEEVQFLQL
jgi:hypothetical protein